jgi:sulfide dehydrogenase [flavocytochrome c] flavoprotein chain
MPKSGFSANTQGKVAAAAIVAAFAGEEPSTPSWANTCYSLVGPEYGISVANVYNIVDGQIAVAEGGGVSPGDADADFRRREAIYAAGWYDAIANDTWGTVA